MFQDLLISSKEAVTGSNVIDGFVVAMVVVVIHPLCDPGFKLRGRMIIIQQDEVFQLVRDVAGPVV